jgi:DNA polymerase elongation subunit (family B)
MITEEDIRKFIEGKHPQQRISSVECGYNDKEVSIYHRNNRNVVMVDKDDFYPFVWATVKGASSLYEGDKRKIKNELYLHNIECKGLKVANENGEVTERMEKGYRILFYALAPMSWNTFLKFFEEGGVPDFYKSDRQFFAVSPVEQHLIRTGKRFFKGFDEYDQLLRFTWDIETTGLNPKNCAITQIGMRTNRGFEKIIHVNEITNERKAIEQFFYYLGEINPDIVTGHNSENFDWNFLITRWDILTNGKPFGHMTEGYTGQRIYKKKRKSVLKLGGEIEYFFQTVYPAHTIVDSLHAVRRAQALDSNFKSGNLKYAAGYTKVKKQNRVYIPGDKIAEVYEDKDKNYLLDDITGEWFNISDPRMNEEIEVNKQVTNYTEEEISEAKILYEKYDGDFDRFYEDVGIEHPEWGEKNVEMYISEICYKRKGNRFMDVEQHRYTYDEEKEVWTDNSNSHELIQVTGEYISDRYLLDDLYEGDRVEYTLNLSNFLICKMLPIPYQKICTMGTAALWKYVLMGWSYENNLAIPMFGQSKVFTGGLSRLLRVGFVKDIVKLDYNSLYPSLTLRYNISPEMDISGVFILFLLYVLNTREKYKGLKKKFGKEAKKLKETNASTEKIMEAETQEVKNDKLQNPFKVFGNAFFGSYGAPNIFPWGSVEKAEQITCSGRQNLRLMVKWFTERKFEPIVLDTDGVNFSYTNVDMTYTYTEKGLNRNTTEGVERTGIEAYVAEFNDLYMRDKMGLGIDEYCRATLNFSRKNYADDLGDGKIKFVGNSIKSKKMPKFIEKFIDANLPLLLENKGDVFLRNYNDYISKIYNRNIPLRDIASIGSIKITLDEYLRDVKMKNKVGNDKARQAHYELAIADKLKTDPGDKIYYVNTGTKKTDGDVTKTPVYKLNEDGTVAKEDKRDKNGEIVYSKKTGKPLTQRVVDHYEYILNCIRIDESVLDADKDYYGLEEKFEKPIEYNIEKYIEQLNNRIKGVLVCFQPDIRNKILITNPDDAQCFTEEDSVLTSGFPNEPGDQDTLEQLLTIEDKEIKFWTSVDKIPPFTDELMMDWEEIKRDYFTRMEQLKNEEIQAEIKIYENIISRITSSDIDDLYEEKGLKKSSVLKEIGELTIMNDKSEFISKKFGVKIGSFLDIIEKNCMFEEDDEELSAAVQVPAQEITSQELPF